MINNKKTQFAISLCAVIIFVFGLIFFQNQTSQYSFLIAGHPYGEKKPNSRGIYVPFKQALLRDKPKVDFGVFAGDSIEHADEASWKALLQDIDDVGLDIMLVPGNHDAPIIEKKQPPGYRFEKRNGSLFVILNSDDKGKPCHIVDEQLAFLQATLMQHAAQAENIFVFMHRPIWANHKTRYQHIKNLLANGLDDCHLGNFADDIRPLLYAVGKPVYLVAGDIGGNLITPFYSEDKNIIYIGTGMGGRDELSHYLTVDVHGANISFNIHSLYETPFNDIKSYNMNYWAKEFAFYMKRMQDAKAGRI